MPQTDGSGLYGVRMSHRVECDWPGCEDTAKYDAKTKHGPWAYLCEKHYTEHRAYPDLGVGRAQVLVYG